MRETGKIDYVEMPGGASLPALKTFFAEAFGWSFVDYGPEYAAFSEGLDGGFYAEASQAPAAPLPVLFSTDLEATLAKVQSVGATITRAIFDFPGGRRFHFRDPAGNQMAVWAEPNAGS